MSERISITLFVYNSSPKSVEIDLATTLSDICVDFSIDLKYYNFLYKGEIQLNPFISLCAQGVADGATISMLQNPKIQPTNELNDGKSYSPLQTKIDSLIVEALKIEDRKFDMLNLTQGSSIVFGQIVSDILCAQTPFDDLDYTDTEPMKEKMIPTEPLPPMWQTTTEDDEDEKEFQEQIQNELEHREFRSIEDAGKHLSRIFSHGWKW